MSSIDDKQRRLLVEFYERHVLPLAAHPETSRLEPRAHPKTDESYFFIRTKTKLERHDFEVRLADEAEVADTLGRMWAGTPLEPIPEELMKLVRHFRDVEEKAEVSAFIYEMF
jgi:hypothetical protein